MSLTKKCFLVSLLQPKNQQQMYQCVLTKRQLKDLSWIFRYLVTTRTSRNLIVFFFPSCSHGRELSINSSPFFSALFSFCYQLYKCPERMPRSLCTASSPSAFLFLQKFSCKKCYMYVGLVAPSCLPWNGSSVVADLKNAVKKGENPGGLK